MLVLARLFCDQAQLVLERIYSIAREQTAFKTKVIEEHAVTRRKKEVRNPKEKVLKDINNPSTSGAATAGCDIPE